MSDSNSWRQFQDVFSRIGSTINISSILIIAIIVVILALAFYFIVFWFNTEIPAVSTPPKDFWETVLDKQIETNSSDFALWYRLNIVLQGALILAALSATILAAVTTTDNVPRLKKYSIVVTAITSALTAILSTFHIRENIDAFIRISGDLQLLEWEYAKDRALLPPPVANGATFRRTFLRKKPSNNEASPELLNLQYELSKKFVPIQAARMRAYASIGAQSLPNDRSTPPMPSPLVPPAPQAPAGGAGSRAVVEEASKSQ